MPSYLRSSRPRDRLVRRSCPRRGFTREVSPSPRGPPPPRPPITSTPWSCLTYSYIRKEVIAQAAAAAVGVLSHVDRGFAVHGPAVRRTSTQDRGLLPARWASYLASPGDFSCGCRLRHLQLAGSESSNRNGLEQRRTRPVLTETADRIIALLPRTRPRPSTAGSSRANAATERFCADDRAPAARPKTEDDPSIAVLSPPPKKTDSDGGAGGPLDKQKLDALINKNTPFAPVSRQWTRTAPEFAADPSSESGFDPDEDRLREECGVFGIFNHPHAAESSRSGFSARCSIAARRPPASSLSTASGSTPSAGRGWSATTSRVARPLIACRAVGHRPCALLDPAHRRDCAAQRPAAVRRTRGRRASRNRPHGNLSNGLTLRRELIRGAMIPSTTDSRGGAAARGALADGREISSTVSSRPWPRSRAGDALVALTNKKLIGARDPLASARSCSASRGSPILRSETWRARHHRGNSSATSRMVKWW